MNRRQLLSSAAVLPALVGCGSVSVSQVSSDVDLIAQGVAAVLPTIKTLLGVKQDISDKVSAIVASIQSTASSVATATSTAAVPLIQTIASGVQSIITTLGGVKLPAWVSTVLSAASALIPTVEQTVGIAPRMGAVMVEMTPAQARVILAAAATK